MLTTFVSALLLAGLVLAPGYVAYRALIAEPRAAGGPPSPTELLAVVAATGVLLTGWLAFVLVEVGLLRLPLLALVVGGVTAGLVLLARRRRRSLRPGPWRWRPADTAFAAVALLALALALRPHETVLGGTDAGVYANTGANIARTGRLLIADDVTASLAPTARGPRAQTDTPDDAPPGADGAIRHLMLRLPEGRFPFADYLRLAGFYVLDLPTGTLTPQFLHLYPTWLGLFGQALGDDGLLYATPILGWLGAVMAGLIGRRLFGPWVGAATLLILGTNSLEIWFVRESLSEAFLQFLLCTAAYGWVVGAGGWGLGAGEGTRGSGGEGVLGGRGPGAGGRGTPPLNLPPSGGGPRAAVGDDDRAPSPFTGRAGVGAAPPLAPHQPPAPSPQPPLTGPLLLAGAALGSLALAHAQFVFAFGLLPPLAVWLVFSRRWRPAHWAFFGPILFLLAHASLHIAIFALGYFEGLYHHVILNAWRDRARLGGLLTLGVVALLALNWQRDRWWPWLTRPRWRRLGPLLLAAGVGAVLAYAYLVRPGIITPGALTDTARLAGYIGAPVPEGPAANLVRLGWYLSPLGMLLAGIGAVAIAARFDQRMLLLAGLTGVYGLAFNLASFTQESYIYSLRRFVPIVLPFLSLAAAYAAVVVLPRLLAAGAASPLRRRLGYAAGGGALAALILFFGVTGRTIIGHVENEGMRDQIARIAAAFDPGDIILFVGQRDEPHKLATPLRFFYGLDALVVSTNNPRGDLIDAWLGQQIRSGRRVRLVLGDNGGKLLLPNYRLEPAGTVTLTMRELERLADQKPFNIQTNQLEYTIYDLRPAAGAPLPGPPFRYQTGPGDELATVSGWYGREADPEGIAYRWTNGDALLRLPWPARRGPLRLRLSLSGGSRPSELGPARVELALARGQNDRDAPRIAALQLTDSFATYEVTIPPDLLPDQPTATVMLALRTPAWQPSEHGVPADTRPLGVRVAWVELASAG